LHQEEKILLSLLKKEIAATMMQSYPGIDPEISNWKGQNITDFQEDLRIKVNGQLSEKWFYTHMKASGHSLPRIDVLNILSQYIGYTNWQDFRYRNMNHVTPKVKSPKPMTILIRITLLFLIVMAVIYTILKIINTQNYRFTFVDSDTGEPILTNEIRAEMGMEYESPVNYISDREGSITIRTNKSRISLIVRSPYYLTDTVIRTLRKFKHNELINLKTDYYALMISYFSQSNVESWEERREQLARVFSDDAIIYQFPDKRGGNAMAIYNKWEFIDKITMPSSGLRQIEILDSRYFDGKLVILRFRIKTD
jgi:hypothetical protein